MQVRIAELDDAQALLDIYAPYVRDTAVTFECDVPTLETFASRMQDTLSRYPLLVAEDDGHIVGYTYASPFKQRAAYDWSVETSIYVEGSIKRQGVGKQLYNALEHVLNMQHVVNLNAFVARTDDAGDKRLNADSFLFHKRIGYTLVGECRQSGFKFDRWYNIAWMHKQLGSYATPPEPFIVFDEVRERAEDLGLFD